MTRRAGNAVASHRLVSMHHPRVRTYCAQRAIN
jgi:hypothetical protein